MRRSYFCPLRGSVDDGEYEDLCDADNRFLRDYAWAIQEKLEEDQQPRRPPWRNFFMMTPASRQSWFPLFGMWREYRGQLYGKIECRFKEQLTEAEEEIFRKWISGQCSDGYGEHFEQQPIDTEDSDLYVSFWYSGDDYFLCSEEELDACVENARQGPQIGGI